MDWTRNDDGKNGKMPFPYKLFQMLKDADDKGFRHFVSWDAGGKSFKVHDSAAFTKYIVPKYFKQTRYKSFQRQLCLYGFDRILAGNLKGSRYHKNFVRGNFQLCTEIKYIGIKSKQALEQHHANAKQNIKTSTEKVVTSEPTRSVPEDDEGVHCKPQTPHISCTENQESFNKPSPVEKRVISPAVSPVSSYTKDLSENASHDPTPISELQSLDDLCLFEGMGFHLAEPFLLEGADAKEEQSTWAPTPSGRINLLPRQVSCGDRLANHNEMFEAWKNGFEYALSMPREPCWSSLPDNEIGI